MNSTVKPIRIMIDLETASIDRMKAAILTLGAVEFDEHDSCKSMFYQKADPKVTEAMGFHIDPSTMKWWDEQDPKIREEAFSGTQPLDDLLVNFQTYVRGIINERNENRVDTNELIVDFCDVELWGNGSDFDAPILESAHYHLFGTWPFDFRKCRCYRTLKSLIPNDELEILKAGLGPVQKHNALYDAKFQAEVARYLFIKHSIFIS